MLTLNPTAIHPYKHGFLMIWFTFLLAGSIYAGQVQTVTVQALFNQKAVVVIDGQQRILSVGKRSPEGVLLIAANSRAAVLEVNGKRANYQLSNTVGGHFTSTPTARHSEPTVKILRDNYGMYSTVGSINGMPVNFLVDTGASIIALNSAQAKRLGIHFRLEGQRGQVTTASGVTTAYYLTLDKVQVGSIILRNVAAAVLDGPEPNVALLGMSFLSKLKLENDGHLLTLTKPY